VGEGVIFGGNRSTIVTRERPWPRRAASHTRRASSSPMQQRLRTAGRPAAAARSLCSTSALSSSSLPLSSSPLRATVLPPAATSRSPLSCAGAVSALSSSRLAWPASSARRAFSTASASPTAPKLQSLVDSAAARVAMAASGKEPLAPAWAQVRACCYVFTAAAAAEVGKLGGGGTSAAPSPSSSPSPPSLASLHARLHAVFLALFDAVWSQGVAHYGSTLADADFSLPAAAEGEELASPSSSSSLSSAAAAQRAYMDAPAAPEPTPREEELHALARDALRLALSLGASPDARTHERLVRLAGLHSLAAAREVFSLLALGGGAPGKDAHMTLLAACARHGRPQEALPLLLALRGKGWLPEGPVLAMLLAQVDRTLAADAQRGGTEGPDGRLQLLIDVALASTEEEVAGVMSEFEVASQRDGGEGEGDGGRGPGGRQQEDALAAAVDDLRKRGEVGPTALLRRGDLQGTSSSPPMTTEEAGGADSELASSKEEEEEEAGEGEEAIPATLAADAERWAKLAREELLAAAARADGGGEVSGSVAPTGAATAAAAAAAGMSLRSFQERMLALRAEGRAGGASDGVLADADLLPPPEVLAEIERAAAEVLQRGKAGAQQQHSAPITPRGGSLRLPPPPSLSQLQVPSSDDRAAGGGAAAGAASPPVSVLGALSGTAWKAQEDALADAYGAISRRRADALLARASALLRGEEAGGGAGTTRASASSSSSDPRLAAAARLGPGDHAAILVAFDKRIRSAVHPHNTVQPLPLSAPEYVEALGRRIGGGEGGGEGGGGDAVPDRRGDVAGAPSTVLPPLLRTQLVNALVAAALAGEAQAGAEAGR
jgi:hypothetical protein